MGATHGKFMVLGPFFNMTLDPPQPYANIRVFHYAAGSDTLEPVYLEATLTDPSPQPVLGDARGVAVFYANASLRLVVKTSVADGDLTLYDWDGVECWHPDAALRSENRGASYPAATDATRGQIFGKTDGAGDITEVGINKDGVAFSAISFQNDPLTATFSLSKGADLASAATLTLGNDGNYFDVTGAVGITAMSPKSAGTIITLQFDGAPLLTHNGTSLILMNGQDFQAAAGDVLTLISEGSGNWREISRRLRIVTNMALTTPTLTNPTINGTGMTGTGFADQAAMESPSAGNLIVSPEKVKYHPGVAKAWVNFQGSSTINASHRVTSITDNGVGDWTINLSDTLGANFAWVAGAKQESDNSDGMLVIGEKGRTTTTLNIVCSNIGDDSVSAARKDANPVCVVFFGDL